MCLDHLLCVRHRRYSRWFPVPISGITEIILSTIHKQGSLGELSYIYSSFLNYICTEVQENMWKEQCVNHLKANCITDWIQFAFQIGFALSMNYHSDCLRRVRSYRITVKPGRDEGVSSNAWLQLPFIEKNSKSELPKCCRNIRRAQVVYALRYWTLDRFATKQLT